MSEAMSPEALPAMRIRLFERTTQGKGASWSDGDVLDLLNHIAALEKERDAAIADNAALVWRMENIVASLRKAVDEERAKTRPSQARIMEWMHALVLFEQHVNMAQVHPSAALLERMRSKDTAIKAMADYIRNRAGHEENCRGWHRPVKDKTAPAWKRRGEWMDIAACTCGPGRLLRLAGALL